MQNFKSICKYRLKELYLVTRNISLNWKLSEGTSPVTRSCKTYLELQRSLKVNFELFTMSVKTVIRGSAPTVQAINPSLFNYCQSGNKSHWLHCFLSSLSQDPPHTAARGIWSLKLTGIFPIAFELMSTFFSWFGDPSGFLRLPLLLLPPLTDASGPGSLLWIPATLQTHWFFCSQCPLWPLILICYLLFGDPQLLNLTAEPWPKYMHWLPQSSCLMQTLHLSEQASLHLEVMNLLFKWQMVKSVTFAISNALKRGRKPIRHREWWDQIRIKTKN